MTTPRKRYLNSLFNLGDNTTELAQNCAAGSKQWRLDRREFVIDKAKVRALENEAASVLKAHFGDRVMMKGGSFDEAFLNLRVQFRIGDDAEHESALRDKFRRIGSIYGLVPSDFDLPLTFHGVAAKLVSVEPGRTRYPFIVQLPDGKRGKITADAFLIARARRDAGRKAA